MGSREQVQHWRRAKSVHVGAVGSAEAIEERLRVQG